MAKKLQEQKYIVLKPIRYKHPGNHYRELITPEDDQLIELDHLEDEDIQLLIKTRIVAPATAEDIKEIDAAKKAAQADAGKAEKDEADQLAAAKKQALSKMHERITR